MMARLRCPSGDDMSMAAIILSISLTVSTSGNRRPIRGISSRAEGSPSRNPSMRRNLKNDRTPAIIRACDREAMPRS